MTWSRREFLKRSCCTAAAGFAAASFSRFGLVNAMAQGQQDYKALVCNFLFGGNDGNNMVVPYDTAGYSSYQQIRAGLALPNPVCCRSLRRTRGRRLDFIPSSWSCNRCSTASKSRC